MRVPLDVGTKITLSSYGKTTVREVVITKKIGEGASCIAYEAVGSDSGIPYVLKECCPRQGTIRQGDGATVCWDSEEQKQAAFSRFRRSYEVQFELQRNLSTENTNVPLAEELLFANNTVYSLVNRRNVETYTLAKDETLQQIFITARAIARAVSAYHFAGYLHLDIKPDNIMVYPETRDMILLLDFDSIVEKDKVLSTESLSYSPGFCAPEQAQHRRSRICEATDRFAIGAIVFSRIFGRTPDSTDTGSFSRWVFDDNRFFKSMSRKVMRCTTDFLHMTLAASPTQRYSSDAEMIQALDVLIQLSDPSRNFIVSADIRSANSFVGRRRELDAIRNNLLSEGSNVLVLQGIGGIGKTELAKQAARGMLDYYDTICFGKYRSSLDDLFHDRHFVTLSDGYLPDGLTDVKRYLDDRALLIIDGLDTLDDPQTADLLSLPCKVIITSRCHLQEQYPSICQLEISELEAGSQEQLFFFKAQGSVSEEDRDAVKQILQAINGYTLLIPLIADLCRRSVYSIRELAEMITKSGLSAIPLDRVRMYKDLPLSDSVKNILSTVLDVTGFSSSEKHVMGSLVLLSRFYVERVQLLDWMGREYSDTTNDLADRGWIQIRGDGKQAVVSLHPIIGHIYKESARPSVNDFRWIDDLCHSYIDEFFNNQSDIDIYDRKSRFFGLICGLIEGSCLDSEEQTAHAVDMLLAVTGFYQFERYHNSIHPALNHLKACGNPDKLIDYQWKLDYLSFISSFNIKSGQKCIRAISDKYLEQDAYFFCLFNIFGECLSAGRIGIELFVNSDLTVNLSDGKAFLSFFQIVAQDVIGVINAEDRLKAKIPFYKEEIVKVDRKLSLEIARYSHGEKFEYDPRTPYFPDEGGMEEFYRLEDEKVYQALPPEKQYTVDITRQHYAYLSGFRAQCHSCASAEEMDQINSWLRQEKPKLIEIQEFVLRNPGMVRQEGGDKLSMDLESELWFALCVDSCFQNDYETAAGYYLHHLKTETFGTLEVCRLLADDAGDLEFLKRVLNDDSFETIIHHILQYLDQLPDKNLFCTPTNKAELAHKLAVMTEDDELIAQYKEKLKQTEEQFKKVESEARIEKDRANGIRFQRKEYEEEIASGTHFFYSME